MFAAAKRGITGLLRAYGYRVIKPEDPVEAQARLLSPRDAAVIVDVGANRGDTVAAYRARFPSASIYAIEPFPPLAQALSQRFSSDPKIKVVRAALADCASKRAFQVSGGPTTHSLLRRDPKQIYLPARAVETGTIEVDARTLAEVCDSEGLSRIDILKVDAEGADLMVLQGGRELLAAGRILILFVEVVFVAHYLNQPLYHDLAAFLSSHKYTLYDLYEVRHSHKNGQLRRANALFVSEEIRRDVLEPEHHRHSP